jgi:hypothetical protein
MSTKRIRDLVASTKAAAPLLGGHADRALLELDAIRQALRVTMTGKGAHVSAAEYRAAKILLLGVAEEAW